MSWWRALGSWGPDFPERFSPRMVRKEGIEPSLREPQSLVLPLHYIGDISRHNYSLYKIQDSNLWLQAWKACVQPTELISWWVKFAVCVFKWRQCGVLTASFIRGFPSTKTTHLTTSCSARRWFFLKLTAVASVERLELPTFWFVVRRSIPTELSGHI